MNAILFDDSFRSHLLPFTFTRPICEIRVGILSIREKWERFLKQNISYFTQDYLQELYSLELTDDNFFIAGSLIPNKELVNQIQNLTIGECLVDDKQTLLALHAGGIEDFKDLNSFHKIVFTHPFHRISAKHDIFLLNEQEIENDYKLLTFRRKSQPLSNTNHFFGNPKNLFIEKGAVVECSVLNACNGFIYVGKEAEIMENCSLRGSVAILEHAQVKMGTKIYGATTIGPHCKVGGEVSNIVMFGYSNKGHDGFLGNSVIGEWCNLGAGTNSSNLKNNYGNIKQWDYNDNSFIHTGLQFCGLMMADHAKCGIGTMFNTATVVGVAANLFGAGFHKNYIPSFTFGSPQKYTTNSFDAIADMESAMMKRRNIELSETYLKILRKLYTSVCSAE